MALPEEHCYSAMVFMRTGPSAQQRIRDRLTIENEIRAEGQTDRYCQSVFAVVPSISTYIDEFFTVQRNTAEEMAMRQNRIEN